MNRDWPGLLAELLGMAGSPFPEYQRQRRELFDAGRYEEAAALWSAADEAERFAINALSRGCDERAACLAIRKTPRMFWVSALQSAVFNRVVDRRIDDRTLLILLEGDLAWKHDGRSVFLVTPQELAKGELARRLEALEISPSGPMWGWGMMEPRGAVAQLERQAVEATGMPMAVLLDASLGPKGGRRPLRARLGNPEVDSGVDEHAGYIRAAFDLPRGVYATVVLREIMKPREDQLNHRA